MRHGRYGIILTIVMAWVFSDAWAGTPNDDVDQAVRAFARAGDQRDVPGLEVVLDANFRVVFTMKSGDPVTVMTRAQYLDQIKAGKLGGSERKVQVATLRRSGGFATAGAKMERADASFDSVLTLVQSGGQWKILEDAVTMTLRSK